MGDSGPSIQVEMSGLNDEDIEVHQDDGDSGSQEIVATSLGGDRMLNIDPGINLGGSELNIQVETSRPTDEDIEMQLHEVSGDVRKEQQYGGDRGKEVEVQAGKRDAFGESEGHNRENWGGGEGIQIDVHEVNDRDVDEEQVATGNVENRELIDKDRGKKVQEHVGKEDAPEINAGRRYPKREIREKVVMPMTPSFVLKPRKAAPSKYTTKLRPPRATTWPRDGDIFGQPIDLSVSVFFLLSCISDALSESWMIPQRSTTLPLRRLVEFFMMIGPI